MDLDVEIRCLGCLHTDGLAIILAVWSFLALRYSIKNRVALCCHKIDMPNTSCYLDNYINREFGQNLLAFLRTVY